MKPKTNGERTLSNWTLAVVVFIAVLMLTFGLSTATVARAPTTDAVAPAVTHTIVVRPNGHDDTADIQAAFNACVSYGPGCTVQLVKGTYYISQIAVSGFQGNFLGMGQGVTIIQGLPNLASPNPTYDTDTIPFWAGLPGPSNPWPVLLTFVNGNFRISGMTITDTYYNPVPGGWDLSGSILTYLWATITVTGEQAYAAIDHVTAIGGAGGEPIGIAGPTPSSFNNANGINFEGMLLPTPTSPGADQIPLSGGFSVTNSVMQNIESAIYLENLLNAHVTVCYNSMSGSPEPAFVDLSNTQFLFCGNDVTNVAVYTGLAGLQSYIKTDLLPSTVYVTGNYFGVNWGGSGPSFFDFGPSEGLASTLNAVVSGNEVVADNSCGCFTYPYTDAIIDYSLESMVVSQNTIIGGGGGVEVNTASATVSGNTILGADVGVVLVSADGTHVTGNLVKNSVEWGIALTVGSSYNLVALNFVKNSGMYDLYWDGSGTGNVWFANVCQTASPPGLC
jgi:hypothetical protein